MEKLVPGDSKTHYNLGVLYKQAGERDKALKELESAEQLDPNFAAPHLQLFICIASLGGRTIPNVKSRFFKRSKRSR